MPYRYVFAALVMAQLSSIEAKCENGFASRHNRVEPPCCYVLNGRPFQERFSIDLKNNTIVCNQG